MVFSGRLVSELPPHAGANIMTGFGVQIMDHKKGKCIYPVNNVVGFSKSLFPDDAKVGDEALLTYSHGRYQTILRW